MCHALLTTCRECTWILSITYPRCSHAKAYAIPPPSCPHRMARRYKASGLCSACKTTRKQTQHTPPLSPSHSPSTQKRKYKNIHREDSLSITPCAVRIAFRDTELGVVAEADKPRESDLPLTPPNHKGATSKDAAEIADAPGTRSSTEHEPRRPRRTRARARQDRRVSPSLQHAASSIASESDADAYVASPSSSPSPPPSIPSSPSPIPSSKLCPPKKPRRRSPGVLERIAIAKSACPPVKKGRRGRPPKRKIDWPDRVDACAWEQVVREREAKEGKRTGDNRGRGKRGADREDGFLFQRVVGPVVGEEKEGGGLMYCEKLGNGRDIVKKRTNEDEPNIASRLETDMDTRNDDGFVKFIGEGCDDGAEEGENIARIIALEAAQREKKWR